MVETGLDYKPCNAPPTLPLSATGPLNERAGELVVVVAAATRPTHPVHLDQDAGLALSVAEGSVSQAGALPQQAALELAHLLLRHIVLFSVLVHHAQLVLLLNRVVVFWKAKATSEWTALGVNSFGFPFFFFLLMFCF